MHRHTALAITLAFLLLPLAGCFGGNPDPSSTTSATTATTRTTDPSHADFDGAAALEFVKGFSLRADGSPRYRMPGSEGQREGADYLWAATSVPGWTRTWQNFTGKDFLAIANRPAASYERSPQCSTADAERLPGLPFHNLLALRPGPQGSPTVFLAAHWDSLFGSYQDDAANRSKPYPGANDGASGVGVLLQFMRETQGVEFPFGLAVLFFDGEDGFNDCYPLVGSTYYAEHPLVAVDRLILLDMVGSPDARFIREGQSEKSDAALVELLWRHGRLVEGGRGSVHFTDIRISIADDHVPFIAKGIPAVDIIDAGRTSGFGFPPEWHTTRDTVDRLDAGMLQLVGSTLLAALQDPAFVTSWDAPGAT